MESSAYYLFQKLKKHVIVLLENEAKSTIKLSTKINY